MAQSGNSAATIGETCVPGRTDEGTRPEELFVELFAQQFGPEKAQCLIPEYAFTDIEGQTRYIDYALKTGTSNYAFEIDGLQWHHPESISPESVILQVSI
jgi:hypothetical protein